MRERWRFMSDLQKSQTPTAPRRSGSCQTNMTVIPTRRNPHPVPGRSPNGTAIWTSSIAPTPFDSARRPITSSPRWRRQRKTASRSPTERRGRRSRSQRGLRPGLSLVKPIVEAHGGTVALNDAPGGGARFTVRLPAWCGLVSASAPLVAILSRSVAFIAQRGNASPRPRFPRPDETTRPSLSRASLRGRSGRCR